MRITISPKSHDISFKSRDIWLESHRYFVPRVKISLISSEERYLFRDIVMASLERHANSFTIHREIIAINYDLEPSELTCKFPELRLTLTKVKIWKKVHKNRSQSFLYIKIFYFSFFFLQLNDKIKWYNFNLTIFNFFFFVFVFTWNLTN